MDGEIFVSLAAPSESMSGENDAVPIVRKDILYIFPKRAVRCGHSLLSKLIQPLLALVRASKLRRFPQY
jgi:hypothetical protein